MKNSTTRREAISRAGLLAMAAAASTIVQPDTAGAKDRSKADSRPFRYCLNMATIRGQKLGIVREIEIAAKAGYHGIEPWVDSVQNYVKEGGVLTDLRKRLNDHGLTVEGAIGFAEWIVDDEDRRAKGLERLKREMDLLAQIGARRFAAPPAGATDLPKLDFGKAAERYRALLEIGDGFGIVPELELWGFSKNLNRIGECIGLAIETGHPKACVLSDVFHLYKGGSDYKVMESVPGRLLPVLHINDHPADPPRDKIDDSFRNFPGDGVAPLADMLKVLHNTGGQKVLSLELFNRQYWAEDPLKVAETGLAKIKSVVVKAGFKA
jgi:sugar phosphate isomerase/epimerase